MTDAAKIPPEALEGLMKKAFTDQAVATGLFWDALLNANLIAPLAAAKTPDEKPDLEALPLLLGEGADGEHVIWLFTSVEAMTDYTEQNLRYISMSSRELLKTVSKSKNNTVLIGPDGLTLKLHKDLVASLSEGVVPAEPKEEVRTVPKEAMIYVGPRSDDAAILEARFRNLFANVPEVLLADFVQIRDDAGSRLLLGLKLVDESRTAFQEVAALVAKAAEGALPANKTIDITLISGSLKGAFEKFGHPFYSRDGDETELDSDLESDNEDTDEE